MQPRAGPVADIAQIAASGFLALRRVPTDDRRESGLSEISHAKHVWNSQSTGRNHRIKLEHLVPGEIGLPAAVGSLLSVALRTWAAAEQRLMPPTGSLRAFGHSHIAVIRAQRLKQPCDGFLVFNGRDEALGRAASPKRSQRDSEILLLQLL